jgi:hypothetical protein
VHGRSDTLIPTNFSSRSYVLRNAQVEGRHSRLSYIEVANGQHFDAFLPFAGFDTRYIPLHLYYIRAMDAMWAHLKQGVACRRVAWFARPAKAARQGRHRRSRARTCRRSRPARSPVTRSCSTAAR